MCQTGARVVETDAQWVVVGSLVEDDRWLQLTQSTLNRRLFEGVQCDVIACVIRRRATRTWRLTLTTSGGGLTNVLIASGHGGVGFVG